MSGKFRIFISSVQTEFAEERAALRDYLRGDPGTRALGPQAPVEYDIPEEVVAEGIVNAVAHRDYASNASVEVQLFPDRLEIWNPGTIHPPLTLEKLYHPHASQPNNPLIAEPLFLTKYIEKAGTGTVDMLDRCRAAGMKQPEFCTDAGFFILTVWRKVPGIGSGPSRDQVTAQVEGGDNLLMQQPLRELADALGVTAAQVTAQVTAQVETLLAAASKEAISREELQAATDIRHR